MTNVRPGTLRVRPGARSIKLARSYVMSALTTVGGSRLTETITNARLDDVELLTSELVANAVQHGGGEVQVWVGCRGGTARVEVHDEHPGLPAIRAWSPEATAGRGLAIVNAMADRWGCESAAGHGKTVWFELDLARSAQPMSTIC